MEAHFLLGPALHEKPSREATEYQGCPVALQGYRENRKAAQEHFERCHLAAPIFPVRLRTLKQVLRCPSARLRHKGFKGPATTRG